MKYPCGCGGEHDEPWVYEEGVCHVPKAEWERWMTKCAKLLADEIDRIAINTILYGDSQ